VLWPVLREDLGQCAHQRGQVTGSVYKSYVGASSTEALGQCAHQKGQVTGSVYTSCIGTSSTETMGQCAHQRGQVTGSVYKSCIMATGQFYVKLWNNVLIREDR
jgi:hypothetical protein